jgi:hypothetical protein
MKTTVELPDELLRAAQRTARREGTTVKSLLEEGLRLALASIGQGSLGVVTDCAGARFRVWCLVAVWAATAGAARCARVRTGSDCAGMVLLSR